ncbi:hypothetical protein EVG20_g2297 [Dentipellis fragilis]|uniref:Methyltransferase domain-containing protein n=1 Tax=Dentipellis fragilis TaxID=205917 RepID=A0A4Y9ZA86_9AGAM|nr:hypothetical protein EVG20_g2297 [Dentipellis fragilis]
MALIPARHPRYTIILGVLLVTAFFLLLPGSPYPYSESTYVSPDALHNGIVQVDNSLTARVKRSERIYQKMVKRREGLIRKFGPNPREIVSFPPDKAPWPAYTVWDFFPPAFSCPHTVERIGALGDGGKWLCGIDRLQEKPDCIIYSVGSAASASFEAELLARTRHCQVWAYDFTTHGFGDEVTRPHASEFFRLFADPLQPEFYSSTPGIEDTESGTAGEEREYWDDRSLKARTHFKPYVVAGREQLAPGDEPKMYTIQSLMRMNGHAHIDVLKVDIEGWEFDTLRSFLGAAEDGTLPVGQMIIELHLWDRPFYDLLALWERLERAGMRATSREINLVYANYNRGVGAELVEYTFMNVKNGNIFVADRAAPSIEKHVREDDD